MDLQALLRGKPFLSNEQVIQLVEEKFNIEVKRLKPLDGYDNQNFLVEGSPINYGNSQKQEMRRYSLKITNSKLSEEFECLKDATYMMQYLRGEGFSCPQPLSSKDANIFELVKCKNLALHGSGDNLPVNRRSEDTFMVRMLTFLPGKTLKELTVVPDNIFEEMGENLAHVHTAFQSMKLDHKPMMEFGDRFIWSLNNVHSLQSFLHVVEDAEQKQMIKEVLDDFQTMFSKEEKIYPKGRREGRGGGSLKVFATSALSSLVEN
ncbi:putative hydroxylysine kinase [Apostichopus japonicus]|uniref:Hydroxylysine kinase n=1 Tax=Stichopus japonicus TaxID=307972 RepID=A0A2G8LMD2_STIJA|nr:putative hydroxylysine kinase [Apostichopus japonicus]